MNVFDHFKTAVVKAMREMPQNEESQPVEVLAALLDVAQTLADAVPMDMATILIAHLVDVEQDEERAVALLREHYATVRKQAAAVH